MDLTLAGVLVAGLSAILGWLVARRSYKTALQQYQIMMNEVAATWLRDFRAWGNDSIDAIAQAGIS